MNAFRGDRFPGGPPGGAVANHLVPAPPGLPATGVPRIS